MGDALGPAGARLVVLGGVVYSVGGLIYALRWPDPAPQVRILLHTCCACMAAAEYLHDA